MARLVGYFDDSGVSDNLLVLAGYVAPREAWDSEFNSSWQTVLGSGPLPLTEFKTHDCRHRQGEFRSWTAEQCRALMEHLVSVIIDPRHDVYGIGEAIIFHKTPEKRERKKWNELAYQACLTKIIGVSINVARTFFRTSDIEIILDRQPKMSAIAQSTLEGGKEVFAGLGGENIRPPTFADSRECPPIQAADLLAHETAKELKNRRLLPESRKVSAALDRLVLGRPHFGRYLNFTAVPGLADLGEMMPGEDDVRLGVLYDRSGVLPNRGRRMERRPEEE